MGSIQFSYSYLLYLIAFVPLLLFYRYKLLIAQSIRYAPIQHTAPQKRFSSIYILLIVEGFLLVSSIFVSANPYKANYQNLIHETGVDIALVLDVSASMQAADFEPNRLEYMKKVCKNFIERSTAHRIGIFIFAQETFTQTPLTFDHKTLLELVDGISYNVIDHSIGGGTAIGDALLWATESLLKSRVEKRDQAIILLTDGENTHGIDPELAAKYLHSKNIYLFIIGMAGAKPIPVFVNGKPFITPSGNQLITSLDDKSLEKIAKAGNGLYFRAKTENGLNQIFKEISFMSKTPLENEKIYTQQSYAPTLTWVVLVLFFLWLLVYGFFVRTPIK